MCPPDLSIEATHKGIVAGVDEAGRGPWAGPVVAAAAILNHNNIPAGIDDCKKIKADKRVEIYELLVVSATVSIGIASVEEIDSLNILGATKLAMQRAVAALTIVPHIALIDGNHAPVLACKTQTVIGGDGKSLSIGAASIIAKVTRDRIMKELAAECPGYGWEHNAGYGTACHQEALKNLGVTPHHRKSFAPIRELLETKDLFAA